MKRFFRMQLLGCALVLTMTACGGGNGSGGTQNALPPQPPVNGPASLTAIAGIGDSLTAGEQSGGLLGVSGANPLYPANSALPGIQATQPNGFWAQLWGAANKAATTSAPVPFINYPGLLSFLIPTSTGGFVDYYTAVGKGNPAAYCLGLNGPAYNSSGAAGTRVNPTGAQYDFGVPGATAHEAIYQIAPEIGQCGGNPSDPLYAIEPLINAESTTFYPVVFGQPAQTTQLSAVIALKPSLTTVWLGANDVAKVALSDGGFPTTNPQQFASDINTIVTSLVRGGSGVAIATIPPIFATPLFIPQPAATAELTAVLTQVLVANGVPAATAAAIAASSAPPMVANLSTTYQVGPGGYFTFNGAAKAITAIVTAAATGQPIPTTVPPCAPGATNTSACFTVGDFVNDPVVANINSLITQYNTSIKGVASANNVALVDVYAAFQGYIANGGVIPVNPPKCCSFAFMGGLFSYDQFHPSNTGYAVIANLFITAINARYNAGITPVSVSTVYATDPYAPH